MGSYLGLDYMVIRDATASPPVVPSPSVPRGLGGMAALGEEPSSVTIPGIPRPVSGPAPDRGTFYRMEIPVGARGTTATLAKMADLAIEASQDPYFVQFARGVVRDCGSRDFGCEADAVLQFVKQNVKYRHDSARMEWIQSPGWTMFVEGQGDCDDSSSLIAAMGVAVGLGASFRAVALDKDNPTEYTHVFSMLNVPGRGWVAADAVPTPARLGWQPPESLWVMAPNDYVVVSS